MNKTSTRAVLHTGRGRLARVLARPDQPAPEPPPSPQPHHTLPHPPNHPPVKYCSSSCLEAETAVLGGSGRRCVLKGFTWGGSQWSRGYVDMSQTAVTLGGGPSCLWARAVSKCVYFPQAYLNSDGVSLGGCDLGTALLRLRNGGGGQAGATTRQPRSTAGRWPGQGRQHGLQGVWVDRQRLSLALDWRLGWVPARLPVPA